MEYTEKKMIRVVPFTESSHPIGGRRTEPKQAKYSIHGNPVDIANETIDRAKKYGKSMAEDNNNNNENKMTYGPSPSDTVRSISRSPESFDFDSSFMADKSMTQEGSQSWDDSYTENNLSTSFGECSESSFGDDDNISFFNEKEFVEPSSGLRRHSADLGIFLGTLDPDEEITKLLVMPENAKLLKDLAERDETKNLALLIGTMSR